MPSFSSDAVLVSVHNVPYCSLKHITRKRCGFIVNFENTFGNAVLIKLKLDEYNANLYFIFNPFKANRCGVIVRIPT